MSTVKTLTKAEREQKKREFKEREMRGRSLLARWYGVGGISVPLGDPRFNTDRGLEKLARTYRRGLEDVRDDLAKRPAPDLTVGQAEKNLREIGRVQGVRETLQFTYSADEHGTDSYDEFCQAGGLAMIAEAQRTSQEPLIRPSYRLAMFIDFGRATQGRLTALRWPEPLTTNGGKHD